MAIGRSVDIAINHDENVAAMHRTNHPGYLALLRKRVDVSPVAATSGKPVGLTSVLPRLSPLFQSERSETSWKSDSWAGVDRYPLGAGC